MPDKLSCLKIKSRAQKTSTAFLRGRFRRKASIANCRGGYNPPEKPRYFTVGNGLDRSANEMVDQAPSDEGAVTEGD
ncbi:MAG: hypothetical protein IKL57_05140 [Oscillospiraceae bacterium]|nr:hypothetical protein [Oscillospiraceae bacterium]